MPAARHRAWQSTAQAGSGAAAILIMRRTGGTVSRRPPRCWTSSDSTSSTRASHRRRRLLAGHLSRAGGRRRRDRRYRPARRDRTRVARGIEATGGASARGLAARASPVERISDTDTDCHQRGRTQPSLGPGIGGRRPSGIAVRCGQGAVGRTPGFDCAPRSAPWASAPKTSSTSPMTGASRSMRRSQTICARA